MKSSHALILNSGGLRSLLATLLTRKSEEQTRVTLLHVVDGRDTAVQRLEHARRQAEKLQLSQMIELSLTHLYRHEAGRAPDGSPIDTLATPQLLMAAFAQARQHGMDRIIWPTSCNGDTDAIASATEQMMLCEHLAETQPQEGQATRVRIEAPLLEYTDTQLIELGGQLGVDFALAWSCLYAGPKPCRACVACRRRKGAFDAAGMVDPVSPDAGLVRG